MHGFRESSNRMKSFWREPRKYKQRKVNSVNSFWGYPNVIQVLNFANFVMSLHKLCSSLTFHSLWPDLVSGHVWDQEDTTQQEFHCVSVSDKPWCNLKCAGDCMGVYHGYSFQCRSILEHVLSMHWYWLPCCFHVVKEMRVGGGAEGERENAPWPPPISIVLPDETKGLPSLQATMANDQWAILKPLQPWHSGCTFTSTCTF